MNTREREARVEAEIAAPLRAVNPTLDELHRARLESAIEATLRREDEAVVVAGGGRRRFWMFTAGVAATAVAAAIVFRGPRTPTPRGVAPVARVSALGPPALLAPYHATVEGASALPPSTSLLAIAGERVRATIGSRVRLTLVGPGRVAVVPSARAGDVELALDGGRLLVDYDGHAGGTLRVRSPGAVTTVVGTLFAVEAAPSGSRVAVARGRVRTEDGAGRVWQVAAGDSWTGSEGRLSPISDELAAALVRHEAGWTAAADPPPVEPEPPSQAVARPSAPTARVPREVDLEALYMKAESAMRAHAAAKARRALETIAERDRRGPLGEAALLDLARLALAEGDRDEARRALARLPGRLADPALAETAEHLRCRVERSGAGGERCGL
jgi:hypothetical protein